MSKKLTYNYVGGQLDSITNNYETDNLFYYNSFFINRSDFTVPASVTETRTNPILKNPSEYLASVIKFDIDCHALPINLPEIVGPTGPPALQQFNTTSNITLRYLGVPYTQNVIYIEDSLIRPTLTPRATIYNYQRWLDFINNGLAKLYVDHPILPGTPPVFIFNPVTQLINIYIDQNYIETALNKVDIFINEKLYLYLTNFSYLFGTDISQNPNLLYKFDIINTHTLQMPAVGARQNLPLGTIQTTTPLYMVSQLCVGTASWNSIRSLILTSKTLPFNPESIPSFSISQGNYNSSAVFPIVSEFSTPNENDVCLDRVRCQYLPTAQYRYFDLTSVQELYTIDLSFFWQDFQGNINVIPLIPGASMSIKIVFQKKKLSLPK